jgi:hypothetical protein
MTSEEKVKQLWPEAMIQRVCLGGWRSKRFQFMVTIKPGRFTYGRMKKWAWKSAWDSITQDEELSASPGEKPPEGEKGSNA